MNRRTFLSTIGATIAGPVASLNSIVRANGHLPIDLASTEADATPDIADIKPSDVELYVADMKLLLGQVDGIEALELEGMVRRWRPADCT